MHAEQRGSETHAPKIERVDVVVVGGGPAGSTVSTFLAQKGYRVTVLEKDAHPRFHIGESLLPCNMPILEDVGVMDQLKSIGVVKLGADFSMPNDETWRTYYFCKSLNRTPPHAYEVRRSEFDEMLFRNAAKNGVDTRERVKVTDVAWSGGSKSEPKRCHVKAETAAGEKLAFEGRYFIDATGRDTLLSKKLGLKKKNPNHGTAAIFGHFKNVVRRPGADQGNISIYWFDHGWMWFIPLHDDVMSIGAVCWPEYLKTRKGTTEEFLLDTIKLAPKAYERMKDATLLNEVRATGNYSYTSERMSGPGWLMVGDAFAFIDPVFSSGVYLAMNSGRFGAEIVDRILRDPSSEARAHEEFEKRIRKGVGTFSFFIYRFTTPGMRWIFQNPRNIYRLEEAVISMLAGDVFDSKEVEKRFLALRALYAVRTAMEWKAALKNFVERRRGALSIFRGVTTAEGQPDTLGFK
jgi:flavin-dependent dehydrogenase